VTGSIFVLKGDDGLVEMHHEGYLLEAHLHGDPGRAGGAGECPNERPEVDGLALVEVVERRGPRVHADPCLLDRRSGAWPGLSAACWRSIRATSANW
jgi:hypothetical protein